MLENIDQNRCFGGWHKRFQHHSEVTNCTMTFAVYLPPQFENRPDLPVWYWLSGLTCTDANFMQKAGAQRIAAELGIIIVAPDTSPRGDDVPDHEAYDLGQGAGFYVNATQKPWNTHFQMYDYVVHELPELVRRELQVGDQQAISGHSMGGHGALSMALKNPDRYRCATAFSPIANPVDCPWGEKAFSAYLGDDRASWKAYDSCELLAEVAHQDVPILVSQGLDDAFLQEQLHVQRLKAAAASNGYPLKLEEHAGYDHSYFFIASFIEQHARFVAQHFS